MKLLDIGLLVFLMVMRVTIKYSWPKKICLKRPLEVYIGDTVIKSAGLSHHLADLRLALERMRQYGLKMNPLK